MAAASGALPKSLAGDGPIPASTSTKNIEFEPNGDLKLRIGEGDKTAEYLVCSRAVSRTSPVFKAMLYGAFIEARPKDGSPWVVNLEEDDPDAAKVVLNIVHHRYNLLEKPASARDLYNILTFTNKYDMTAIIRPWASLWFPDRNTFEESRDYPALVGIASELGAQAELRKIAKRLVAECRVDAEGKMLTFEGEPHVKPQVIEYMPLMSPALFDYLAHERAQLVDRLHDLMSKTTEKLIDLFRRGSSHHSTTYCAKNTGNIPGEKRTCDAITLGFIVGEVDGSILWAPGKKSSRYQPSLNTLLLWELNNIVFAHIGMTGHESCPRPRPNQTVAADIRALLNGMSIYLPRETEVYLRKQTEKVGAIEVEVRKS